MRNHGNHHQYQGGPDRAAWAAPPTKPFAWDITFRVQVLTRMEENAFLAGLILGQTQHGWVLSPLHPTSEPPPLPDTNLQIIT